MTAPQWWTRGEHDNWAVPPGLPTALARAINPILDGQQPPSHLYADCPACGAAAGVDCPEEHRAWRHEIVNLALAESRRITAELDARIEAAERAKDERARQFRAETSAKLLGELRERARGKA